MGEGVMTTAAAISAVRRIRTSPELLRLRSQAALVRALLDEIERVVPWESGGAESTLGAQLAEELSRLGDRVLECAARMTP